MSSNEKSSDISYPGKEKWMSVLTGAMEKGELDTEVAQAVKKVQAGGKRRSRKAGSKKTGSKKAASKKSSRKAGSKKSSHTGGAKKASRRSRKGRKQGRTVPPAAAQAMEAFRGLAKHISQTMGIAGGPVAITTASYYKNKAQEKKGDIGTIALIDEAKKIFDADSESNRKAMVKKAEDHLIAKRAERKAKKQSGGGRAPSFSETSEF